MRAFAGNDVVYAEQRRRFVPFENAVEKPQGQLGLLAREGQA